MESRTPGWKGLAGISVTCLDAEGTESGTGMEAIVNSKYSRLKL